MFIEPVAEGDATGEVADYYESQRESWGFLPDYAGAFSPRPAVARAWGALSRAVVGGLDRRRYEIATIAAARARRSSYCTAAHSLFLRDVAGDADAMRSLAADPSGAGLDEVDRAVYAFAEKVASDASRVEQADVDRLRELGLSDTDVADVVYAAAARAFFTTVLDGLGARLDREILDRLGPDAHESMIVGRPAGS